MSRSIHFPDRNQNFWHLTSIQGMSFALPGLILPGVLAKQYGNGTALCSLLIANLIIWIASVAIVSMSSKEKNQAIENVKKYLGKKIGAIVSLILLVSFLTWYALQIASFNLVLETLEGHVTKNVSWILSSIIGLGIAFLSIGGIRIIRKLAMYIFPILLTFILVIIAIYLHGIPFSGTWGISFAAVALSIAIELPGTVNLPTFFRHSQSKYNSMLALILINLYLNVYSIAGICLNSIEISGLVNLFANSSFTIFILLLISILSLIGSNLVNIYYATAGWETFFPNIAGKKEFAILGILGTLIFSVFHQFSLKDYNSPLLLIENLASGFLGCLTIIVLIAYLMETIIQHRLRRYEKLLNCMVWLIGCFGFIISFLIYRWTWSEAIVMGIGMIIILFILILFIEETGWSAHQIAKKTK